MLFRSHSNDQRTGGSGASLYKHACRKNFQNISGIIRQSNNVDIRHEFASSDPGSYSSRIFYIISYVIVFHPFQQSAITPVYNAKQGCVCTQPCPVVKNTSAVSPRRPHFAFPDTPDRPVPRYASRWKNGEDDRSHETYSIRNLQNIPLAGVCYDNYQLS